MKHAMRRNCAAFVFVSVGSIMRSWLLTPMVCITATSFGTPVPGAASLEMEEEKVTRTSIPGEGVIFRGAEKNLHCVAYGAGYVWCGFSTSPSLLLRVDPTSMTGERIVFNEERGLHDLSFDGMNVWAVHSSGHLSAVEPRTKAIRTERLGGRPFVYTSHFDGRDVWMGLYSEPGRVLRVNRQAGDHDEFVIHEAPNWSVRGIASDGKRLWVCLYTVPAMVAIVHPEASSHRALHLGRGDDLILCTSIVFDGDSMWVGLDTMPATLVRIDVDTLQYRVYSLDPRSSCCRSLVFTQGALWAGLYTEPAQIVRFDPQEESYEVVVLPDAYFNARDLACDGKNLWVGLQNVRYGPSALYRLPMAASYAANKKPRRAPAAWQASRTVRRLQKRDGDVGITSQDWYRVRRGEDQIAWGETKPLEALPKVVLSRRAADELAFLRAEEREAILSRLAKLSAEPTGPKSRRVRYGGPRRISSVGGLRIIYRVAGQDEKVHVSTIRKGIGVSFDPENMGPPPRGADLLDRSGSDN